MPVQSLQCNNNYDFEFDNEGKMAVVSDGASVADMLRLDISSNRNWILSDALGIDWVNEKGSGLLQTTGNGDDVIATIIRRIEAKDYIDSVESVSVISDGRAVTINITVKTEGNTLSLEVVV